MSIIKVIESVLKLSTIKRRLILRINDILLISFSFFFTKSILYPLINESFIKTSWFLSFSIFFGSIIYSISGQYKGITKYIGSGTLYPLSMRNLIIYLLVYLIALITNKESPVWQFWFLNWSSATILIFFSRIIIRDVFFRFYYSKSKKNKVIIYGAGEAGAQLAASLKLTNSYLVSAFIDDSANLQNRELDGIPIYLPEKICTFQGKVDHILLAIPSLCRNDRKKIVEKIQKFDIPILQIPSLDEITSGQAKINSIRKIKIEELLGRDPIHPNPKLLEGGINGENICITGAGGSIGSELCRQIILLNPKTLVILDNSESNLYKIEQELNSYQNKKINIVSVLGDACNSLLIENIFKKYSINTVFHSAAYKHVPLVEYNPIAGLKNNVISTKVICESSERLSIKNMVLISTDKAVRATNVMGASKRLAEMIVQSFSQKNSKTCFSMVRFGNVLGSSGSVVPLFKKQIAAGGPITITHPEIIRYFMTIKESAQLVIQSTELAKGGDVFLLDMGEPIKIVDLAKQMILLSGLTIKDKKNPDGDIEIIYTGLRPGEKLFEELLINSEAEKTFHPLIFRANEECVPKEYLIEKLNLLERKLTLENKKEVLGILLDLVPEWKASEINNPNGEL